MKDITVILVHYDDFTAFQKALYSLEQMKGRISSVIAFQSKNQSVNDDNYDLYHQMRFIHSQQNLHEVIDHIATRYVLFIQGTDYIAPRINVNSLKIPHAKTILGIYNDKQNIVIHRPLLVSTSFLQKNKLFSASQLPFKEAFLPAWLSRVQQSAQIRKDEGLVKQSRQSVSSNTLEKAKFIQKYQFQKVKPVYPSISVMISNYNMTNYVETAIVSCLLQNEPFEQILIMDDGSTDNSYQQIKRWQEEEHVKVFTKKNEGKAKALNQLLPHVAADFVLELDADDWLDPDAVSVIKTNLQHLHNTVAVLYGNFRRWKQLSDDVLFKRVSKGRKVRGTRDLLAYEFPLGPRIYRTSILKKEGGFPVIEFADGRMYEDVSVLIQLSKKYPLHYEDFTVYNVREHVDSITKKHGSKWKDYLKGQNLT
ncbi:MAG TPA: glycosyltransferase family A protein [Candidatus Dormibacteraeota bacterium]|nr:glycosyltransferase family A protein [Candidatus Dormibacteraeota bacterium]